MSDRVPDKNFKAAAVSTKWTKLDQIVRDEYGSVWSLNDGSPVSRVAIRAYRLGKTDVLLAANDSFHEFLKKDIGPSECPLPCGFCKHDAHGTYAPCGTRDCMCRGLERRK